MTRENCKKSNKGFTLIEILLVMGLLGMILGLTLFIGMDSYQGSSFRGERDALVGVLQRARNQAVNNICTNSCSSSKPHGVHITNTSYTIFQGASYTTRDTAVDEVITIGPLVQIALGSFTDVVFAQLSGDATTTPSGTWTLTMTDLTMHNSVINISSFGQITWTN